MMLNLFIRQPFTEAGEAEKHITQEVLNCISRMQSNPYPLTILTGLDAVSAADFKTDFTHKTGVAFTAKSFRDYRLELLNKAHGFIIIRTGLSESSSFEIAYNIFKGKNIPIFYAIWNKAPLKTTLLQELNDLNDIAYCHFDEAHELEVPIRQFIEHIGTKANFPAPHLADA